MISEVVTGVAGFMLGCGYASWKAQRRMARMEKVARFWAKRVGATVMVKGKVVLAIGMVLGGLAVLGGADPAEARARCRLGLVYRPSLHACSHHRYGYQARPRHHASRHHVRVVYRTRMVVRVVYRVRTVHDTPAPPRWAGALSVKRSDFQ
jgi:hypothetical protein